MVTRARAALAGCALGVLVATATAASAQATRGLGALPMSAIDAPPRLAVVVGNGDYAAAAALPNAASDAQAIATFLEDNGFVVHAGFDLDKRGFERLLRDVIGEIDADTEVVLFYAGHGIQIGRRNFLLPVDADLREPFDVPFETIALDRIVTLLSARSRLQLVLLDSCRENPFEGERLATTLGADLFETRQGFDQFSAPVNTLLSYSTSPGQLATDGDAGAGSPYARAMLDALNAAPRREIGAVLSDVRRAVFESTSGAQVPWESSTLLEPFYFEAAAQTAQKQTEQTPTEMARTEQTPAKPTRAGESAAGDDALAALDGVRIAVDAPLDRVLALDAVAAALSAAPEDAVVSLAAAPSNGTVFAGDRVLAAQGAGAPLQAVDRLRFAPSLPLDDLDAYDAPPVFRDVVRLAVEAGGARAELSVDVTATMSLCDWLAGAQFDPQGLGVARLPNELEPERALAACEAALADAPTNGRLLFQKGRALVALRRNAEAAAAFEAAAAAGHARALAEHAQLITQQAAGGGGGGVAAPEEALALMRAGVDAGDPLAMHVLGQQLLRHGGDQAARERGFDLLSRAVDVGHTFAMNELGFHFVTAEGAAASPERGMRYLRESAARGDIYGYNNLGLVALRGLAGDAPDGAEAERWFRRAAEGGHPFAPGNLGRLYVAGVDGAAPDYDAAMRWYDEGLDRGDAWSGANGAWIILNRDPAGYGAVDAAVRAAKAAALRRPDAGEAALELLRGLDRRTLDAATQSLLVELGERIAVDGAFGPQSRAALARRLDAADVEAGGGALGRLEAAALAYWRANSLRLDLF